MAVALRRSEPRPDLFVLFISSLKTSSTAADANSPGQASYLLFFGLIHNASGRVGAQLAHLRWKLCESGSDHSRYLRSVERRLKIVRGVSIVISDNSACLTEKMESSAAT